ncbi:MAG: Ca-activated chloride channel family protein [Lentimonas sp.]|jgi:Ca-activated chloride channel family protein
MKLLPEDSRLTAYALGEIEDEQERSAIEAAVEQSPELQQAVAAIREMGELLTSGLATEPSPELTEFEKAKMDAAVTAPTLKQRFVGELLIHWPVALGSALAAAAAVAVAIVMFPQKHVEVSQYSYDVERPAVQPNLSIDGSMKAVEGLDVRVELQTQRVEALNAKLENFEMEQLIASDLVATAAAKPLVSYDDFNKDNRLKSVADGNDASVAMPTARSVVDSDESMNRATASPCPVPAAKLPVPHSKPAKPRMQFVGNVAVAQVDIELPDMEQSFTVSSGLGSVGGDASRNLLGRSRALSDVSVFGSKTMSEEEYLSRSRQWPTGHNAENYDVIEETDFRSPLVAPLSTFSIDVDTASYANVRRFLNQGQLPPADAVRIEEMINYFPYADAAPTQSLAEGGAPFAVHMAQAIAPWNTSNRLLRVALKGYEMPWEERPASNLVFLLDVSGSMNQPTKLPLVKEAMDLLIRRLDARDRVAIVVYAGASGLVLPSTTANNRETIAHALNNLKAGGSTNAGAGIELAYKTARQHFIEGGNNRVILCTDGDFNVGQTNRGVLADTAEAEADAGVSLTILGFGMGTLKDGMLETLSNKGKGTYAYVDSSAEARKVFLEDLASHIFKIAKDVKIQVEFNPAQVQAYRLIGYENRRLKAEDFNNDKKKAGDIGPGHSVVALYEIVPADGSIELPGVDALRYQQSVESESVPGEVATVKLRYKQPEADVSQLITRTVDSDDVVAFDAASEDVRFSAIVAAFAMRLSGSEHVSELTYDAIESIAASSLGVDSGGHRSEFVGLVRQARDLSSKTKPTPVKCRGAGDD